MRYPVGFDDVRRGRWSLILLALAVSAASSVFVNRVVFPGDWVTPLSRATAGLVQPTLVVNAFGLAITLVIVVRIGRLRLRDLGLRADHLVPGVFGALAYWLALQLVIGAVGLALTGTLAASSVWEDHTPTLTVGALAAQLLGAALDEEVLYRGLLLVQLYLLLRASALRPTLAMGVAVALSSAYFSLMHVPSLLYHGYDMAFDLPRLFVAGALYALLYVYSGNLPFVVGVHALGNWNMPLAESGVDSGMVAFLFRMAVVALWSGLVLMRRRNANRAAVLGAV